MKNIVRIFTFAALCAAGTLTSCDDVLEQTPKSTWDVDSFYQTETQVELGMAGMYNKLANSNVYGSLIMRFDSGSDEGYLNRSYSDSWAVGLYRMTPSTPEIKKFWTSLYTCIDLCNMFEAKVANSSAFDEATKNLYLGEERFLRALAYFNLVQWFGPVPMPESYAQSAADNDLVASTREEVYAQIITDLEFAILHLPKVGEANFVAGRASHDAARGLLARVYMKMAGHPLLQTDKYSLAWDQCKAIMDGGRHGLVQSSQQVQQVDESGTPVVDGDGKAVMVTEFSGYRELFLDYIQNRYALQESIFEISYNSLKDKGLTTDAGWGCLNGVAFSYGGGLIGYPAAYAFMNVSPALAHTYEDGDKRKEWNVAGYTYDKYGDCKRVSSLLSRSSNPGKYRRWEPTDWASLDVNLTSAEKANGVMEPYTVLDPSPILNKNTSSVNVPVIRYADILLMFAEADNAINNGPTAEAIAALDLVRQRANLSAIEDVRPDAVASQDAFLKELQDERMRELCFEGLRKQDLIRWGILGERLQYQYDMITGEPDYNAKSADHQGYLRPSLYFDATKHLSLPYPDQEVKLNKLLDQKDEWK